MLEDNASTQLADSLGWLLYHVITFFGNLAPGYITLMMIVLVGLIVTSVLYAIRKEVMK